MIERVRRKSGSRLPSMVVEGLHDYTWRTSPSEAGQQEAQDTALTHLKEHLSWVVQGGRDTCAGCGQTRSEDTPMLTAAAV